MIIVSLEGIDKCGKGTQAELLAKRLRNEGYRVVSSRFHRYGTPTGELIRRWLFTKSGHMPEGMEPYDVDQKTIELIMAADKQAQQEWISSLEDSTDVLILDRGLCSQIAYGMIANKMANPDSKMEEIEKWLSCLTQYIRRSDLTIMIDIPAEESIRRKGEESNDRYESNLELLESVRSNYYYVLSKFSYSKDYAIVNGMQPIDHVHEQVYLKTKLKLLEK